MPHFECGALTLSAGRRHETPARGPRQLGFARRRRPLPCRKFGATSVTRDGTDWIVRAEVESASARDANRELLSELRRVERKTRLRAEWTAGGSVERFFDYVPKGTRPAGR